MNQAHFHLMVNHLPIILPIAGVVVLVGGMIVRSELVKRMAYILFSIGAVAALSAMTSGEGAEEVVENIAGVTENYIHEHEEKADVFALMSYILGALSLVGLWASWKGKRFSKLLSFAILVLSLVVLFLGKQTGTSGGEIRHTEIRSGQTIPVGAEEDGDDD
ncbi:MAG: hypothetical protein NWR50_04595 [Crocinitomicaceae bacterium]|nr:hypothetical protein [Crocinitomicaceae bacterium]